MDTRSLNQLSLYHAYLKQLWEHGTIKIDLITHVWEGDLKQYVIENYKHLETNAEHKSVGRYLLKMMDTELPTRNPITSSNMNKNHFDKAFMEDLTQHISFLREQLIYNNIEPYNG